MMIPKPNGPFPVGCADVMTNVLSLPKTLNCPFSLLDKNVNMGTFTRLYYPTDPELVPGKYAVGSILPDNETTLYTKGILRSVKLTWLSFCLKGTLQKVLQHTYIDAPIITESKLSTIQSPINGKPALPLVIVSHGLLGFRNMYSAICSELASYGCIVASVEHRDGSASPTYFRHPETNKVTELPYVVCPTAEDLDDKSRNIRQLQVERRTEEVSRLLDLLEKLNEEPEKVDNCFESKFDLISLKGRIDVGEPMMLGHSFGGATTLNVVNKDDRFKCAFALDAWFLPLREGFYNKESGYKKPTYHIFTERFNWNKNIRNCERYLQTLPEDYGEVTTLRHSVHVDQSDSPGFTPKLLQDMMIKIPKRNYEHGINVQRKIILDYFGKYLKYRAYPIKLLSDDYTLPEDFKRGISVYGQQGKSDESKNDD